MDYEKHVDFEGLMYYDQRIKKYIDDMITMLQETTVTEEELQDIKKRIDNISSLVTLNSAQIQELFNNDSERLSSITQLLSSDKVQGENIKSIQTRIESLATKESLEEVKGSYNLVLDDIKELEAAILRDHELIETLLVSIENKASKEYVDSAIANIPQSDLSDYATKEYVLEKINDAVIGSVDLTNYYNKETIDSKLSDVNTNILNNNDRIDELVRVNDNQSAKIESIQQSFDNYYNKTEIEDKLDAVIKSVDLSDYYTKSEVENLIPDDFATTSDIAVLNEAVSDVQQQLDEKVDSSALNGLATEEFVLQKIAEAELSGDDIDLSEYYTKTETDQKISTAISEIVIPDTSDFVTMSDVEKQGYLTEHQDISHLATKAEVAAVEAKIPSVDNYVTNTYIQQNYTTTQELQENYVTTEKVTEVVTQEVNTVVTEQVETKVTEVIENKIATGDITITPNAITYGDF